MFPFLDSRIHFKTYNGNPFIYVDYSKLNDLDMSKLRIKVFFLLKKFDKGTVRILYNLAEIKPGMSAFQYTRSTSKEYDSKILKSAVINIPMNIIPFYQLYKKVLKPKSNLFQSEKDALNYLFQ